MNLVIEVRGVRCSLAKARRTGMLRPDELEALAAPTEIDLERIRERRQQRAEERKMLAAERRGRRRVLALEAQQ